MTGCGGSTPACIPLWVKELRKRWQRPADVRRRLLRQTGWRTQLRAAKECQRGRALWRHYNSRLPAK